VSASVRALLRYRRRSVIALMLLCAGMGVLQASLYAGLAGDTAAERVAFAEQSQAMVEQFSFIAAPPTDLSTLGGYLTWRVFGSVSLLLGFWAIWFAASTSREDESDGIVEALLAAGVSRTRLVWDRVVAFAISAVAIVMMLCLGIVLAPESRELAVGAVAAQGVVLVALLATVFGIAMVAAQTTRSSRTAAGWAAALLFGLNLVNAMRGSVAPFATLSLFSPFSWYSRSEPLVDGGQVSPGALAGSLAVAALLVAGAAALFSRRDIGEGAVLRRRTLVASSIVPQHSRRYAIPVVGALYERRRNLGMWMLRAVALVGFFTTAAPAIVTSLEQIEALQPYLDAITGDDVQRGIIGLLLLGTLQLYLALLALAFVSQWARDDRSGRLEIELSAPVSRTQLVARRALTVSIASLVLSLVATLVLVVLAGRQGVAITGREAVSTVAILVPFALVFGAVGLLLTATIPRGAVLGLGAMAVVSYFVKEVAPLYDWPAWVLDLSVFHLAGNPLAEPLAVGRVLALCGVAVGCFLGAAVLMRRRDVGT
jgi:ABC-2 type transport system permease protein